MRWLLICVFTLSAAMTARAELTSDGVGIVAMANSRQSVRLAEHYAAARGIPKSQILLLDGEPAQVLSRADWATDVRPTIHAWLTQGNRREKIRCLVTCWDVPLKIDRRAADSLGVVTRKEALGETRANRVDQLGKLVDMLGTLGTSKESKELSPTEPLAADISLEEISRKLDTALKAAQQRVQAIQSEDEKKKAGVIFERLFLAAGGSRALLRMAAERVKARQMSPEQANRLALLQGRLQGTQQGIQALSALPDSATRDVQMLNLIQSTSGLVGATQWIDQQSELLRKNETYSSFDSELSLIWWPDYPLFRWQPNPLHYRYDAVPFKRPTMMVSRLAAPTIELAMGLVDQAVAVEKTGLAGKVYLDARGMKSDSDRDKPGSYGQYDQSLRDLAERLKKDTKLAVTLNDEAKLFQAGECPDTALYCGWYSLAKYVDAFDWKPGSVGYHLASSEASVLRKPGAKVWCNAMLEDGVCATLGPVYEPYLSAFPLPDDFFPLLLTGRHTLVETYYRTKPFNSWVMVLVGDPLYNPYKNSPLLKKEDLPERMNPKAAKRPE